MRLNKQEILDWISEHELAWEDFVNYFEDIYQSTVKFQTIVNILLTF